MTRAAAPDPGPEARHRARDLGILPGELATGRLNAITDVPGVLVGHETLDHPADLHTGVTAVLPHDGNVFRDRVRAGLAVGNGFGKLVGATQLYELGELETPIVLTGTLSAFRVADALVSYILDLPGNEQVRSVNPVVGETNDGYLSDGRRRPLTEAHVRRSIESARGGAVAEGCVGAGAGTMCFGWKGGIGTASRSVALEGGTATLGALVQSNFGGALRVLGAPIAAELPAPSRVQTAGSCMIVVATDAPLDSRQLSRLARRAVFGLARVGSAYSHGSGDYAIAFSTERVESNARIADDALSPLFAAALEAVEESVLNSLFMATTTAGRDGHEAQALPLAELVAACRRHGVPARLPDRA